MRGKVRYRAYYSVSDRITPAYAGKRQEENDDDGDQKDHPRLCGEKLLKQKNNTRAEGSPPPMRGKAFLNGIALACVRITPAYAGKSRLCSF